MNYQTLFSVETIGIFIFLGFQHCIILVGRPLSGYLFKEEGRLGPLHCKSIKPIQFWVAGLSTLLLIIIMNYDFPIYYFKELLILFLGTTVSLIFCFTRAVWDRSILTIGLTLSVYITICLVAFIQDSIAFIQASTLGVLQKEEFLKVIISIVKYCVGGYFLIGVTAVATLRHFQKEEKGLIFPLFYSCIVYFTNLIFILFIGVYPLFRHAYIDYL